MIIWYPPPPPSKKYSEEFHIIFSRTLKKLKNSRCEEFFIFFRVLNLMFKKKSKSLRRTQGTDYLMGRLFLKKNFIIDIGV